jgi:hypothetical protein
MHQEQSSNGCDNPMQTRSTAGMEDVKVKEKSMKNVKIYSPVWGVMIISKPRDASSNKVEGYTLDGRKVSVMKER